MMKFLEYLIENYGYDEPIFATDLYKELRLNKNTIRQLLKRETDKGNISRYKYKNGIYFIPKPNSLFKRSTISLNKIINKKYILNKNNRIGYITGLSFANQIGLTTQNPVKIEIVTNNETNIKRDVDFNIRIVTLRKPRVSNVNNNNFKLLQVMDLLNNFKTENTTSFQDAIDKAINYLHDVNINAEEIRECVRSYPAKTQAKFWESGIYNELTSK